MKLKGTEKAKKHSSKAEREYLHRSVSQLPTKQQQSEHGVGEGEGLNQWN